MAVVTMRQLLESGVHFGHQTRRWNPKMKRFIMTERNGIYIIDLQQSVSYINSAYEFVKETVAHGGTILFVGTKKQAQEPIAEQATRVGMPYVNHRWLGGMLTNFQTISKRLTRLKELEELNYDDVAASGYTKKELLIFKRERDKLEKTLGGIRTMAKVPSAVWIVDTKKEHLAVDEAKKLGLPVIAILDTNCDPDEVDYKIPGNDDAIRSVTLLTRVIADAVADGSWSRAAAPRPRVTRRPPRSRWPSGSASCSVPTTPRRPLPPRSRPRPLRSRSRSPRSPRPRSRPRADRVRRVHRDRAGAEHPFSRTKERNHTHGELHHR
jgi:small subunit ribosomal protein S2